MDEFVKLEHEMYVPDLVTSEVNEENVGILQKYFLDKSINQESFSYHELTEIQLLEIQHGSLSIPDCSCLFLAKKKSATLLTGDARLRKVAENENVPVHGILWIFEELIRYGFITYATAHDKLLGLVNLNCRLPREEIEKIIIVWKKKM